MTYFFIIRTWSCAEAVEFLHNSMYYCFFKFNDILNKLL